RRALRDAVADGAQIVNLSLGEAVRTEALFRRDAFLEPGTGWPVMTDDEVPFWLVERTLSAPPKAWFDVPDGPVVRAARDAARAGAPVLAAAGNDRGHVFVPALATECVSVAFQRTRRQIGEGGMEVAQAGAPSFTQSEVSDVVLVQPQGALGTSFASPLLA